MAHIFRLIAFAALCLFSISSQAAFPVPSGYTQWQNGSCVNADPATVIRCALTAQHGTSNFDQCGGSQTGEFSFYGQCRFIPNDAFLYTGATRTAIASCPANSTQVNGQCVCGSGFSQNAAGNACVSSVQADNQQCRDNAAVSSAEFGDRTIKLTGSATAHPGSGSYCLPSSGISAGRGCTYSFVMDMGFQAGSPPVWYSTGAAQAVTGVDSCALAVTPSPTTPVKAVDNCSKGYPGTVNGITVCVPLSGQPTVTTKKVNEVVAPPGGPEQATETITNTVCNAVGACTTTNVVSVNGAAGTSTTTTQSKGEYCTKNPTGSQCLGSGEGSSSGFGGNCVAGFVGTGDALQKATAEAVNKTNCLLDSGTALDDVKAALSGGTFGPELTNVTKTISQFNQSNPLGSTPLSDHTIVTGIGTFVIPFSSMAGLLQALGNVAVIFTLLYATLFVVKGF